jgi:hypothetical protein
MKCSMTAWLVAAVGCYQNSPASVQQAEDVAPASPGADQCCDYFWGGATGVHSYTCCAPQAGTCGSTTFHGGSSTNSYCDLDGNPTGGGVLGSCYQMPTQCPRSMCDAAASCQQFCDAFQPTNLICWSWTSCFRQCMGNQLNLGSPTSVALPMDGGTCSGQGCPLDASTSPAAATCADGECVDPVSSDDGGGPLATCPAGYELVD